MGTNSKLGGGGFHHVAIRARDFDRSVAFYRDVLGCEPKITWGKAPSRAIMLDTGDGNYIEIFERPNQAPPAADEHAILHLALRTSSTDAALKLARDAGCTVTMEAKNVDIPTTFGPHPVPVRIAFFKGPDGEVIELFENALT